MDLPDRVLKVVASQLGNPRGMPGRVLGRLLNRANRSAIRGAVDALDIPADGVLADFGFGGGSGLDLLLCRLGGSGEVHGVDQSVTMLTGASHRFRRELDAGHLILHKASLERLPLSTATVDGAITLNTLYFITDLAGVLGECARVLKPSGQLVIGLGDPDVMARQAVTAHGFHLRPMVEVTNTLHAVGLEVDQHQVIGTGDKAFHLLVTQHY